MTHRRPWIDAREPEWRGCSGPVELRAAGQGLGVLTGYAAVFGRASQNLGGFVEVIDSKAFNKSLADGGPVFARFNHEDNFLLGTTQAGTLRLAADRQGLRYEIDLPDTSAGRDVRALAERGDLRHSSFAFQSVRDDWGTADDGGMLRTLLEVRLVDVAPVVNPAYLDTTTGLRSLADHLKMDLEEVRAAAASGNLRPLFDGSRSPGAPAPDLSLRRRRLDLEQLMMPSVPAVRVPIDPADGYYPGYYRT